jgi:hypothetical protein
MGKMFVCLVGVVLGGGGMFFSYNYHVVRAEKEWLCVPRKSTGLADVYADVRAWRAADWQQHGDLARSLVAHGRGDLVVVPAARGLLDDVLEGLTGPRRVGEAGSDDETATR